VVVSGGTGVHGSIAEPGVYTGVFPMFANSRWRRVISSLRRLPDLESRLRRLEGVDAAEDGARVPGAPDSGEEQR
jgi:UDP-3-O-[3-hydroxymyristoyl] glucosamine N-acyltransferase